MRSKHDFCLFFHQLTSIGRGEHPLKLKADFMYSKRFARPAQGGLFPAGYRIPEVLRHRLRGRRVAIVNDVTHAGSAVRGTFSDLEECGATVVGIGSLLVLGTAASEFAAGKQVPLITLAQAANQIWTPQQCPLCASGVSLQDVASFATQLSAASLRALLAVQVRPAGNLLIKVRPWVLFFEDRAVPVRNLLELGWSEIEVVGRNLRRKPANPLVQ
jgi:hypothetical protein